MYMKLQVLQFLLYILFLDFSKGSLNFNLHRIDSKVRPFRKATLTPSFRSLLFKFSENPGMNGIARV